jgi:hypothetical protein
MDKQHRCQVAGCHQNHEYGKHVPNEQQKGFYVNKAGKRVYTLPIPKWAQPIVGTLILCCGLVVLTLGLGVLCLALLLVPVGFIAYGFLWLLDEGIKRCFPKRGGRRPWRKFP